MEKDQFSTILLSIFKCVPDSMMPGQLIVILCKYLLRLRGYEPNFKLHNLNRSKSRVLEKIADLSCSTGKLLLSFLLMVFFF